MFNLRREPHKISANHSENLPGLSDSCKNQRCCNQDNVQRVILLLTFPSDRVSFPQ